jgi:hypothetical protein
MTTKLKLKNMFSVSADAKTSKGEKYGFLTGILYLAPAKLSGYQVCPMAELAQCEAPCLNSAGRGAFNSVQLARIAKTRLFFENRDYFMQCIVYSVRALVRKASKLDLIPLVRLNGTSDIRWETIPVTIDGKEYPNVFEAFPNVQFYDYTKIANRKDIPANYDLTFSYSGVSDYARYAQSAINAGMRVAVVFRSIDVIPSKFLGLRVVPGDNSDIRHLDPQGSIVALYAKGKAKKDNSGFVIDPARKIIPIALSA